MRWHLASVPFQSFTFATFAKSNAQGWWQSTRSTLSQAFFQYGVTGLAQVWFHKRQRCDGAPVQPCGSMLNHRSQNSSQQVFCAAFCCTRSSQGSAKQVCYSRIFSYFCAANWLDKCQEFVLLRIMTSFFRIRCGSQGVSGISVLVTTIACLEACKDKRHSKQSV